MQQLSPSEELFLQAWKLKNPGDQMIPNFYFPEVNYRVQFGHPASQTALVFESAFADQKTSAMVADEQQKQHELENRGWQFVRFSTEEIYNSPDRCVAIVQDCIRRRRPANNAWSHNSMPGGMYPMPPTPYGQPPIPPQPYQSPYAVGYPNQAYQPPLAPTPYVSPMPQPYQPGLPPGPTPYRQPMQAGMYQFQQPAPYAPPMGVAPYGPPYTRPGYRYEYDPVRGWLEKRPYSVWVYTILPIFAGPIGITIALLLACFKEPNPTIRTVARTLTVLGILVLILALL